MSESFCGKECVKCTHKEMLNCSGCKDDYGKANYGFCTIAKCSQEKGHATCDTCTFLFDCNNIKSRGNMIEYRKREQGHLMEELIDNDIKNREIGKWLKYLWGIYFINVLCNFFITRTVIEFMLVVAGMWGICAVFGVRFLHTYVLYKLAEADKIYKSAFACSVAVGVGSVAMLFYQGTVLEMMTNITLFVIMFFVAVQEFYEVRACYEYTLCIDFKLASVWEKIEKWCLVVYVLLLASMTMIFSVYEWGIALTKIALIPVVIFDIFKCYYLNKTAKVCN